VDNAVWNTTLPSVFCITWWMWPFSTVTEPNRRHSASACSPSSVPQPQSGYTALIGRIELGGLGELGDVAGVEDERRANRQAVEAVHGPLQGCGDVGIGRLVEADVAVADLGEHRRAPHGLYRGASPPVHRD
jgi:hypothetical protein